MQDHGLFQAICRTNRLDTADKDFGYIVDYKDLFKKVENAIAVYASELDHSAGGADPEILLESRVQKGKERLDAALEALALLVEKVEPPKGELEHIHYFCGNTEIADDLKAREPLRVAFYTGVVGLLRAYALIADELEEAGYSASQQVIIRQDLDQYVKLRELIRLASGETLDLKPYEADMRHLIDTYIAASEPRKISEFDNVGLLDLIVKTGIADAIAKKLGSMKDRQSVAEAIENNVRSKIVKDHLTDPAYFAKMSALLDEIIKKRKEKAIEYEEYLKQMADLAIRVQAGKSDDAPAALDTRGKRALFNNLIIANRHTPEQALALSLELDAAVKCVRPDGWRGVLPRENVIKHALWAILKDDQEVEAIFRIIEAQKQEY